MITLVLLYYYFFAVTDIDALGWRLYLAALEIVIITRGEGYTDVAYGGDDACIV